MFPFLPPALHVSLSTFAPPPILFFPCSLLTALSPHLYSFFLSLLQSSPPPSHCSFLSHSVFIAVAAVCFCLAAWTSLVGRWMCWGQQGGAVGLAVWPAIGHWAWHCWVTVNAVGLMEDAYWCPLLTVCSLLPRAICHRDSKPLQVPAGSGKVQSATPPHFSCAVSLWSPSWLSPAGFPTYSMYLAFLLRYEEM